jgi:hypothetical protein
VLLEYKRTPFFEAKQYMSASSVTFLADSDTTAVHGNFNEPKARSASLNSPFAPSARKGMGATIFMGTRPAGLLGQACPPVRKMPWSVPYSSRDNSALMRRKLVLLRVHPPFFIGSLTLRLPFLIEHLIGRLKMPG